MKRIVSLALAASLAAATTASAGAVSDAAMEQEPIIITEDPTGSIGDAGKWLMIGGALVLVCVLVCEDSSDDT